MQHQQQDKRPLLSDSEEANELVSNDDVGNCVGNGDGDGDGE